MQLEGRHVLLGVTGGIAAYKAAEFTRLLVKAGADVRVVMTRGATAFVGPLTFQALSGHRVRSDLLDADAEAAMGHIELARWADEVVVAPATADFLARLATGRADDLLTTTCLATEAPIVVAPAMNSVMWANDATQANVTTLVDRGVRVVGPADGDQACGETGPGRMVEPRELLDALTDPHGVLAGRSVLITAGPTFEDLDPVRFLGNRSSGKMGYALAAAARRAGADVVIVSGPTALRVPAGVDVVPVRSAQDMLAAVSQRVSAADIFIGAAAVADYRPTRVAEQKIKKCAGPPPTIALTENPDILARVASTSPSTFCVGFAAETENVLENARSKLDRKGADMIIANRVGPELAFEQDHNAAIALWRDGERTFTRQSKAALAVHIIACVAERLAHKKASDLAQDRSQTA